MNHRYKISVEDHHMYRVGKVKREYRGVNNGGTTRLTLTRWREVSSLRSRTRDRGQISVRDRFRRVEYLLAEKSQTTHH